MGMSSILFKGLCVLGLLFGQQVWADEDLREAACSGACRANDMSCFNSCMNAGIRTAKPSCPGPCAPGDVQCLAICKEQKSAPSDNVDPQPSGPSCTQELASLVAACDREVSSTEGSCDEKNDSGMNSVSSQAAAVALALGQQTSSSIQAACSGMATLAQAANAALAAYRLNCSSAINSCKSSCSSAVSYYKAHNGCEGVGGESADYSTLSHAQSQVDRCNNFTANVQQAQQAIANYGQTSSNASQCASLTSADNSSVSAMCATNPNLPGCSNAVKDCNDPSMASSRVCICAKNPGDPSCVGTLAAVGDNKINSQDMSSRLASQNANADSGGDTPGLPSINPGQANGSSLGQTVDGKQGGGVAFGSSGSSGSSGGAARGPASAGGNLPNGAAVNSGFYGGGGSGSGGRASGSNGGSRVSGLWNRITKAVGVNNKPDLRQFLPGGSRDPNRGIAGASGPDGITGPHSNIWQKVQNRYRLIRPSLIP